MKKEKKEKYHTVTARVPLPLYARMKQEDLRQRIADLPPGHGRIIIAALDRYLPPLADKAKNLEATTFSDNAAAGILAPKK